MSAEPRLITSIKEQGGKVELVEEFAGADGLIYAVYAVIDGRGRAKILVLKNTPNGFTKKAMQVLPADVEKLVEALRAAKGKLREMI